MSGQLHSLWISELDVPRGPADTPHGRPPGLRGLATHGILPMVYTEFHFCGAQTGTRATD